MKKKLFDLKEWLTIEDTAKHMSVLFGESVSEADVLRLALDGHVQMSVNLVNHAYGIVGSVTPLEKARLNVRSNTEIAPLAKNVSPDKLAELPKKLRDGLEDGSLFLTTSGDSIGDDTVIEYETKVIETLSGIWDLPLIGAERLDVEHAYQIRTNGPGVELVSLGGTFVRCPQTGLYAKLLEPIDDNISPSQTDRDARSKIENYYPSGALPPDSSLVVQTSALRAFEEHLSGSSSKGAQKPLTAVERNTYLAIIAGLCDELDINLNQRGVPARIRRMTDEAGQPVSDDTIRRVINQIHDDLSFRKPRMQK